MQLMHEETQKTAKEVTQTPVYKTKTVPKNKGEEGKTDRRMDAKGEKGKKE